jgi:hypothetical protein
MRVSELMAALAPHCATNPEVFYGPYALMSITQADPDNGRLYLTVPPEQAEPEQQAAEQQAEPLTLEQRVEALEKRLSDYGLTDLIADSLDYDKLAMSCADHISMREVASHIDGSDIAENISIYDIVAELDMSDIAGYIDTEDVAEHLDLTDTVRKVLTNTRLCLDTSTD